MAGIATCATLTALVACSKSSSSDSKAGSFAGKTLTLAVGPLNSTSAQQAKFYKELTDAFHKATGATLKIEYIITDESVQTQLVQRAAVARSGPDMIYMGTTTFPTAYFSKAFISLTPAEWKEVGGQEQFYPNMLKMSGPNTNDLAGIPLYNVPNVLAYNTELFKKAGISGPPKTWDEFVKDAQKINDPSKGIYGTGMDPADDTDPWKTLWYLSKQYGSDYVSKDLKKATIDSNGVQAATKFWFDWYTKFHIVDPNSLTWKSPNMEAAFAKGKIGELLVQKPSYVPLYESSAIGKNFAFADIPQVPYGMSSLPEGGSAPTTVVSGDGVVVAKYAPRALVIQFLKVALSTKIQVDQYKLTGELPVTQAAGKQVEVLNPQINKPALASTEKQQPTPFVAAWGTVEAAMASVTSSLAAKIASNGGAELSQDAVKKALQGANSSVQAQLH